jgi:type IV secretion system protein VirB9
MKKILFLNLLFIFLSATPAYAATASELEMYEQAYRNAQSAGSGAVNVTRTMPDYFSKTPVALSKNDQEALKLAESWARTPSKPILLSSGKVAFLHGASIPTIIAAPLNITDLEFEAGESIQSVMLGDTARWQVDSGSVGNIPHIFIKPLDAGLDTSAVITTGKRIYHLRLVSQVKGSMPYIGFIYPESNLAVIRNQAEKAEKQAQFGSMVNASGQSVDVSSLDFNYRVDGSARWKPVQIYNDGLKTYIKLPPNIQEMPILLSKNRGDILVNYRVINNTFIVDGLFDELSLILGVGSKQEQISIRKM